MYNVPIVNKEALNKTDKFAVSEKKSTSKATVNN